MTTFLKKLPCVISSVSETTTNTLNVSFRNEQLVVESEGPVNSIKVFDVTGKLCLSNSGKKSIPTEGLKSGVYLVQVEQHEISETVKLFIP